MHNFQKWKQPRCPSGDERLNKLWCIHTVGCYSATERNDLSSNEKTGVNIKCLLLNERNQAIYCIILVIRPSKKRQKYRDGKNIKGLG